MGRPSQPSARGSPAGDPRQWVPRALDSDRRQVGNPTGGSGSAGVPPDKGLNELATMESQQSSGRSQAHKFEVTPGERLAAVIAKFELDPSSVTFPDIQDLWITAVDAGDFSYAIELLDGALHLYDPDSKQWHLTRRFRQELEELRFESESHYARDENHFREGQFDVGGDRQGDELSQSVEGWTDDLAEGDDRDEAAFSFPETLETDREPRVSAVRLAHLEDELLRGGWRRNDALAELFNHRDARSVELLLDELRGPNQEGRLPILRALWHAAVDGFETEEGDIDEELTRSLSDPDPVIAEFAAAALKGRD